MRLFLLFYYEFIAVVIVVVYYLFLPEQKKNPLNHTTPTHQYYSEQKQPARSMRSNHSTWDPRRPLYEELKAPPVPRRHYHGSDDCYHARPAGRFLSLFLLILLFCV